MYEVRVKKSALKSLEKITKGKRLLIIKKLRQLEHFPKASNIKKLKYPASGYRARTGDYRILFILYEDKKKIEVYIISHRKDAYR